MKYVIIFFLRIYQKILSPDHGMVGIFYPYGRCKWYPSCSEYAVGAITSVGAARGGYAAAKRVLRCHPWSSGGIDHFSPKGGSQIIQKI